MHSQAPQRRGSEFDDISLNGFSAAFSVIMGLSGFVAAVLLASFVAPLPVFVYMDAHAFPSQPHNLDTPCKQTATKDSTTCYCYGYFSPNPPRTVIH